MGVTRTIGRVAKEAGVSVETVRYYERQGMIDQPPRTGGPRHYDDRALAMLKYIRVAQGFGLTLREIKSLRGELGTGRGFCRALQSLVENKLVDIARKQTELSALAVELEAFLGRCKARAAHLPCPVVEELADLNLTIGENGKDMRFQQ
jgi:MerR family mercuric resistance operon transcriptional regulator